MSPERASYVPISLPRLSAKTSRRGRRPRYVSRTRVEYHELVSEVEELCAGGLAISTQRAAASARRCFEYFLDDYKYERPDMFWAPNEEGTLSMRASMHNEISLMTWCAWMIRAGLKPSTVTSYLSLARSTVESELGFRLVNRDLSLRMPRMLRRLRRMYGTVRRKRLGWRAYHHRRWRRKLGVSLRQMSDKQLMAHATTAAAREGLTRTCELAPDREGGFDERVHPSVGDVSYHVTPRPHIVLQLLPAKKSPGSVAKMPVPFPQAVGEEVGAFHAIVELLRRRTGLAHPFDKSGAVAGVAASEPLFAGVSGRVTTAGAIVGFFQEAATLIGLQGEVSGHSGRIGGATDHFARETPPAILQICGRWDSDLWQIYTRQCIEQTMDYTVRASECDDVAVEEIFDDYTQPAVVFGGWCAPRPPAAHAPAQPFPTPHPSHLMSNTTKD